MQFKYPAVGICGLACRLCPSYHAQGESKCGGCKSAYRMAVGCPFITCAKKKGVEFCWECDERESCERWRAHRAFGQKHDTFVCYQKLEANIAFIQQNSVQEFERTQKTRERLLDEMLDGFNEGRSKTYYSIAATVMQAQELKNALAQAKQQATGLELKDRARVLHMLLDEIAAHKRYVLKLRKTKK